VGDYVGFQGGDGADVGDYEDGNKDAPPHAKEELVAVMAVISHRWQHQISPSEGGRRVLPPSPPQKIMRKIGHRFSFETKACIK
jgi:hypothetical protein